MARPPIPRRSSLGPTLKQDMERLKRLERFKRSLDKLEHQAAKLPPMCEECGVNAADLPSRLCPGCAAYQEHQR